MRNFLFLFFYCIGFLAYSQVNIEGTVYDRETRTPLSFATVHINGNDYALSSVRGTFKIVSDTYPLLFSIHYPGYEKKTITISSSAIEKIEVLLTPLAENLETITLDTPNTIARRIIKKAIQSKKENNPQKSVSQYSYKSYNKFKITEDNTAKVDIRDTTAVDLEHIFNDAHSFLSEKVSLYRQDRTKNVKEKQTVLATRMTGFKTPVYDILGITIQSHSLYEEIYTIFDNGYAGPLSKSALKNYHYKVLDTTQGSTPAYVILFQPKKSKKTANLEGVLYLDTETLAIQKAIAEVRGELNILITHEFQYKPTVQKWFPIRQKVTIRPGSGKQKVSLFGGKIAVGRLEHRKALPKEAQDFLISETDYFDFQFNTNPQVKHNQASIEIDPEANARSEDYWNTYRTSAITQKDLNSFPVIDSIVKAQNIARRINVIKSFNLGYYPLSFFDLDLTYPIKYNNFEGLRLGIGGLTNEKLSKRFRIEGYGVYGFKDRTIKYGIGGGVLLNKTKGSWLNVNYTDDLKEVGSFAYLTDRRIYSLFEPRLVNIDFYYKHKTWSTSLQHRILPKLLSETQLSRSSITPTAGYSFLNAGITYTNYTTAEASIALRWSPFSDFLNTPDGMREIHDGFPKITLQYTRGIKGISKSDFSYSKMGVKIAYDIRRLDQSKTSFLLEGDIAIGTIPLTHLYHAYPNAPTKETVFQRFSVAGRRSFETMFFSEFFSDRLATLQIRHQLRPITITQWLKPEVVLISRYAIGDIRNTEQHQGISFNALDQGYQESGFEINKLLAGFGLSFTYRYGAYHLPNFEDNIAFKFTFYLKL